MDLNECRMTSSVDLRHGKALLLAVEYHCGVPTVPIAFHSGKPDSRRDILV